MDARSEAQRLYQEEHLSPSEIAEKLGAKPETIRKWKQRDKWDAEDCHVTDSVTVPSTSDEAKRKRHARARKKIAAIIEESNLTEREKTFCIAYLSCANAPQAALEAGYTGSRNTLKNTAWETLRRPDIQAELKRLKEIKLTTILADGDDLDDLHRRIAFADLTQFVDIGKRGGVKLKKNDQIDGQLVKKITWGKSGSIELKDGGKSLDYLERYCKVAPMDQHKIDYDKQRLEIELQRVGYEGIRAKLGLPPETNTDEGVVIINDLPKDSSSE